MALATNPDLHRAGHWPSFPAASTATTCCKSATLAAILPFQPYPAIRSDRMVPPGRVGSRRSHLAGRERQRPHGHTLRPGPRICASERPSDGTAWHDLVSLQFWDSAHLDALVYGVLGDALHRQHKQAHPSGVRHQLAPRALEWLFRRCLLQRLEDELHCRHGEHPCGLHGLGHHVWHKRRVSGFHQFYRQWSKRRNRYWRFGKHGAAYQ